MDNIALKEQIRQKAYEIGIDKIGFTMLNLFMNWKNPLQNSIKGHQSVRT